MSIHYNKKVVQYQYVARVYLFVCCPPPPARRHLAAATWPLPPGRCRLTGALAAAALAGAMEALGQGLGLI